MPRTNPVDLFRTNGPRRETAEARPATREPDTVRRPAAYWLQIRQFVHA